MVDERNRGNNSAVETTRCPHCAEEILAAAVYCKHCTRRVCSRIPRWIAGLVLLILVLAAGTYASREMAMRNDFSQAKAKAQLRAFIDKWPTTSYAVLAQQELDRIELQDRLMRERQEREHMERERHEREKLAEQEKRESQERERRESEERERRDGEERERREREIQVARRGLRAGDTVYFYSGASISGQLWFDGTSNFIYLGRIVFFNEGNTHASVQVERIERYWGRSKRPDPRCMPYTDEHDYTFGSPYGRFCTGETILLPLTSITDQREAVTNLFK